MQIQKINQSNQSMVSRFAIDTINESLLPIFGLGRPPLKYFCYDEKLQTVKLCVPELSVLADVSLKRLSTPSGILSDLFSKTSVKIRFCVPCWAFYHRFEEALLILKEDGHFVLWGPFRDEVWHLPLPKLDAIVNAQVFWFAWRDNEDASLCSIGSLMAATKDGCLYVLPLYASGEVDVDLDCCLRMRIEGFDPSTDSVLVAQMVRISDMSVAIMIVTKRGLIVMAKISTDVVPRQVDSMLLADVDIQDVLVMTDGKSIYVDCYGNRDDIATRCTFSLFKEKFAEKTTTINLPGTVLASCNSFLLNQTLLLLRLETGVVLFDPITCNVITEAITMDEASDLWQIHVDSTLRIHFLQAGASTCGVDQSSAMMYTWTEPSSTSVDAASMGFDLVDLFDIVQPFTFKSLSNRPVFQQLLQICCGSKDRMILDLRSWTEMRDLLQMIDHQKNPELGRVLLLYLLQLYQPQHLAGFARKHQVSKDLLLEASAYQLIDSDQFEMALSKLASIYSLQNRPSLDLYALIHPSYYLNLWTITRWKPLTDDLFNLLVTELKSNGKELDLMDLYGKCQSDSQRNILQQHLSEASKALLPAHQTSPQIPPAIKSSTNRNLKKTRPASPMSPRTLKDSLSLPTTTTPSKSPHLASPIKASASRHHPKLPSRLAEQVRVIDTPSPASSNSKSNLIIKLDSSPVNRSVQSRSALLDLKESSPLTVASPPRRSLSFSNDDDDVGVLSDEASNDLVIDNQAMEIDSTVFGSETGVSTIQEPSVLGSSPRRSSRLAKDIDTPLAKQSLSVDASPIKSSASSTESLEKSNVSSTRRSKSPKKLTAQSPKKSTSTSPKKSKESPHSKATHQTATPSSPKASEPTKSISKSTPRRISSPAQRKSPRSTKSNTKSTLPRKSESKKRSNESTADSDVHRLRLTPARKLRLPDLSTSQKSPSSNNNNNRHRQINMDSAATSPQPQIRWLVDNDKDNEEEEDSSSIHLPPTVNTRRG